jgi:hypothetical protein
VLNTKVPDLTPTEMKIVDQNDKSVNALKILDEKMRDTKAYSSDAFQGAFSHARASIVQALPWIMAIHGRKARTRPRRWKSCLRVRLSGRPKLMLVSEYRCTWSRLSSDCSANPNMPDATRQELLDRTRRFVQENRDFLAKQSEMIRNRSNFKPGALEQLQPPAAPDISQIPRLHRRS